MPLTTAGIDFAALTLKDALDLATLIEEEAQERYEELADSLEQHRTFDAARFFRFMARNEEKHKSRLIARRRELFAHERTTLTRGMIFDVEAPEYDAARADMTLRKALQEALAAEQKAYAFFVEALPQVTNRSVRELFEELRDEEVEHRRMVREELEKAPPDPRFPASAFADEPTAQ